MMTGNDFAEMYDKLGDMCEASGASPWYWRSLAGVWRVIDQADTLERWGRPRLAKIARGAAKVALRGLRVAVTLTYEELQ